VPATPVTVHFAPGTQEDLALRRCAPFARRVCVRQHWYRPFSRHSIEYWDTRSLPDGTYVVTVIAWDVRGNEASTAMPVVVANHPADAS
jgi:hypothetical protein